MLRCVKCAEVCRVFKKKTFGSLVGLEQVCPRGHSWKWESQPRDGMLPLGNLQLAGSLFFSGSSPVRGLRMLSFFNLQNISLRTFYLMQKLYLIPSVKNIWLKQQVKLFTEIKAAGTPVVLGGDGRCDSPGHCAKYGSYTLMDLQTCKVLDMKLVQVTYVFAFR